MFPQILLFLNDEAVGLRQKKSFSLLDGKQNPKELHIGHLHGEPVTMWCTSGNIGI